MKTFKIGNVIRKVNDSNSPSYRIVGKWIHPHTKEYWYDLRDTTLDPNAQVPMEQAIANVLYEGDTDDYELVEEEKEKVEEELNKWYPIVDEGEYWTESDMNNTSGYRTIVTDGSRIFTFQSNKEGWATMARRGWKYMRIYIE